MANNSLAGSPGGGDRSQIDALGMACGKWPAGKGWPFSEAPPLVAGRHSLLDRDTRPALSPSSADARPGAGSKR